ncbi:hypothetical protein ID866_10415 [Astraeus odoratus]|nr:hypothetical protein ID866_10415 [Astraeus odoratus]
MWQLEDGDDQEVIEVGEDDEEEMWSHFTVPTHLTEEYWDALGALTTMVDTLSMRLMDPQHGNAEHDGHYCW